MLKFSLKSVEVLFFEACRTSTRNKNLHQSSQLALLVEISLPSVKISVHNTFTKRSPNQAPFDKISKSGGGGGSGGSIGTKRAYHK